MNRKKEESKSNNNDADFSANWNPVYHLPDVGSEWHPLSSLLCSIKFRDHSTFSYSSLMPLLLSLIFL